MRRMFSENQIKEMIKDNAVEGVAGKDIAPKDINASGNIEASGTIDGQLKQGPVMTLDDTNAQKVFELSRRIGDTVFYQLKIKALADITSNTVIGEFEYKPSSNILLVGATTGGSTRTFTIFGTSGNLQLNQATTTGYEITLFAIIQVSNQ